MSDLLPPKLDRLAREARLRKDYAAEVVILSAMSRIIRLSRVKEGACKWTQRGHHWKTTCRQEVEGSPQAMTFCPFCGGRLHINTKGSQQ